MSFLDQGFLDSGYLEDAAAKVAAEHPELASGMPVPTNAAVAGLAGNGQLGLLDGTITIPFINLTMTKKQALFFAVVIGLAIWMYKEDSKKKKR